MTITTRARLSLFLAIAALLVAGIAGAGPVVAGSEGTPATDGGGGTTTICAAPGSPPVVDGQTSTTPAEDCDDTVSRPEPPDCGEQVVGTGPDAAVSYTPCPGDDDSLVHDVDDGAQLVEPRPGMDGVRPHIFDHAVVGGDDRSLTIFFWSGVEPCYVLDHVDVAYDADAITVTLFEGHDATEGDVACIEIALLKKVVVPLDEPVGDRIVMDGAA